MTKCRNPYFCIWLSNFPTTICWRDCILSMQLISLTDLLKIN
jgi:hypothetical protein